METWSHVVFVKSLTYHFVEKKYNKIQNNKLSVLLSNHHQEQFGVGKRQLLNSWKPETGSVLFWGNLHTLISVNLLISECYISYLIKLCWKLYFFGLKKCILLCNNWRTVWLMEMITAKWELVIHFVFGYWRFVGTAFLSQRTVNDINDLSFWLILVRSWDLPSTV